MGKFVARRRSRVARLGFKWEIPVYVIVSSGGHTREVGSKSPRSKKRRFGANRGRNSSA